MIDRLHYFGATHRTAAIAVREKLARGPERLPRILAALRGAAGEALVLNTCGRFEVYLAAPDAALVHNPAARAEILNLPEATARLHLQILSGRDAARHALRVAAGLESRLLGEDQILAQVRSAFSLARREKACGPLLSALFQAAIHTGRRVRSETRLGHYSRSYAALAAVAAVDRLERLDGSNAFPAIIVLGTGILARDVSEEIRRRSSAGLLVVGRHMDRVRALAASYRGEPHGLNELPVLLRRAGVLVACATTEAPLVRRNMIPTSGGRLLIDLGMPRNIEQAAGELPGVTLIHLDMLRDGSAVEREAIEEAEQLVAEELTRYQRWLAGRALAPRIVHILESAETAPGGGSPEFRRALHKRIMRLKEEAAA